MNLYKKYKNYILGAIIIVLLFVAYTILFDKERVDVLSISGNDGSASGASPVELELLANLLELRSLELNEGIFSDPSFRSLRDFSQPLTPQPVGRNNPFAPIGGDQVVPEQ